MMSCYRCWIRRMMLISPCFLSQIEPKKVIQALTDPSWIEAMQEELLQFKLQKVWTLVDLPKGIDSDEVFAPVARIKAIKLFLAYASFIRFIVYQMDVKSAFLYGTIEEEVYVCQPPGFEDPQFLDKVYKVEKALYGLHQAPRTWHETLSTYLIGNGFRRGTIDKTLFIKKDKGDILLVQVYVDGLQVQQKKDGIFIIQDQYVVEILKKFDFITMKTTSTPTETNKALIKDEEDENVDVHLYRSMIGSLMYLIVFQVTPKTSHLHAVKRIFRYLKGLPKLGLWYPRDSPFYLEAFFDSDYAEASLDKKSTIGGLELKDKKELAIPGQTATGKEFSNPLMAGSLPKTIIVISESSVKNDLLFDADGITCLTNDDIFEFLALIGYEQLSTKLTFQKELGSKEVFNVSKVFTTLFE
ncbi:putative ribonuclease H-like domain-containing protein [Tanacetum coccineum]|uniref:Ribonuclease H-like domain-containing protein n=1 Tax=Tanacetum coccineum TaxID=301880 RepID=A0ABQ5E682_9ASTR